jgi:hypothetical protein
MATFQEKCSLQKRGAVDPLPSEEVEGLLVGNEIAFWRGAESSYGSDAVRIFPAIYRGEKAFIIQRTWCAAMGYCASGTEEDILSFEEGVDLLLKHGAYSHMWSEEFAP